MPGYIGNVPTPQSTQSRQTFTATAGQTTFGTVGYSIGYIDVFLNGVHLVDSTDYTATNGSDVVLSSGAALNDVLEVVIYSTFEVANFTSVGSDIVPSTDDTFDLGSSSKAWAEAHVGDLYLPEQASAPSTAANEGAVYTKQSGGQSELFYREESDGDEVQITNGGVLNAVPSGSVTWFAANSPPTGWLECDGSAISRTTYATLFSAIGTTFGVGDGSTTFDLPDLRGEFIRGWDNGKGTDSGRTFGSSQTDAFQGHYHDHPFLLGWTGAGSGGGDFPPGSKPNVAMDVLSPITDGSNGTPRTAAETRPRNIALLPIIKY